jgi:hypothetical protein
MRAKRITAIHERKHKHHSKLRCLGPQSVLACTINRTAQHTTDPSWWIAIVLLECAPYQSPSNQASGGSLPRPYVPPNRRDRHRPRARSADIGGVIESIPQLALVSP